MFPFSCVVPPMAISGSLTISFCPNSKGCHVMFSQLLIQSFSRIIYLFFQFFTHLWTFSPCYLCLFLHDFFLNCFSCLALIHPLHHFSFILSFLSFFSLYSLYLFLLHLFSFFSFTSSFFPIFFPSISSPSPSNMLHLLFLVINIPVLALDAPPCEKF